MSDKMKITVFGVRDEDAPASCGCGPGVECGSGQNPTKGDIYEDLVKFIGDTGFKNSVDVQFVDLMNDDLSQHDYAKETLDKGYQLPITFINNQPVYAGGIDNRKIFLALKKLS